MNMHASRHIETRTFKTDGGGALEKSRTKMGADSEWVIATTGDTAAEAREQAQEKVKAAVTKALQDDRTQITTIYHAAKWKLAPEVKNRAEAADSKMKSENKSAWPEVFA